jgi:hypothetical protein
MILKRSMQVPCKLYNSFDSKRGVTLLCSVPVCTAETYRNSFVVLSILFYFRAGMPGRNDLLLLPHYPMCRILVCHRFLSRKQSRRLEVVSYHVTFWTME